MGTEDGIKWKRSWINRRSKQTQTTSWSLGKATSLKAASGAMVCGTGATNWAACPWDATEHPVSEWPLLKASHLGSPGLTAIQCHKRWAESKLGGMWKQTNGVENFLKKRMQFRNTGKSVKEEFMQCKLYETGTSEQVSEEGCVLGFMDYHYYNRLPLRNISSSNFKSNLKGTLSWI